MVLGDVVASPNTSDVDFYGGVRSSLTRGQCHHFMGLQVRPAFTGGSGRRALT